MGTRSITVIHNTDFNNDKVVANIYKQFDGYPDGWGQQLYDFCKKLKPVNGYSDPNNAVNGAGCFAAQLIAKFKDGVGDIYLQADSDCEWCDYSYHIYVNGSKETLKIVCDGVFEWNLGDEEPDYSEAGEDET